MRENRETHKTTRLNHRGQIDLSFVFDNSSDAETIIDLAKKEGFNIRAKQQARIGKNKPGGFSILVDIADIKGSSVQKTKPADDAPKLAFGEDKLVAHIKSGLDMLPKSAVIQMLMEYLPEGVGLYNTKDPFIANGVVSINTVKVEELV